MNLVPTLDSAAEISQTNHLGSDRHCVVRCEKSWYAFPATAVREITYAPPLSTVPGSHMLLAGICHLRSEFLPVIRINLLFNDELTLNTNELKLIVLTGKLGNWGVLVTDVAALEVLETLTNNDVQSDDPVNCVVQGTAMFRDEVVRVIDPVRLHQLAHLQLQRHWQAASDSFDSSPIQ